MIWNIYPILNFEILGVFLNTLTGDDKYPVRDCEKLPLLLQRQLSSKRKSFFQFFVSFVEFSSNFKHFQKKGRQSQCITEHKDRQRLC